MFDVRPSSSPRSEAERSEILASPGFGVNFTDHMAVATWTENDGWHDSGVVPYGPFLLDPATSVLHYAQEVFEGLKAYRHADDTVWLFRPDLNADRFARSARRLALPVFEREDFLGSIESLIAADLAWVPTGGEQSLYLRPFLFASCSRRRRSSASGRRSG
jgi:branched-chain amino acid aminotransferase